MAWLTNLASRITSNRDFHKMYTLAKRPRSTSTAGFTIIEILIVLVIAGLFLLIVFEAIPALERSSRNNQRKQDVQAILEAISSYELNNSGDYPPCGYSTYPSCFGNGNLLQYTQLIYYINSSQVSVHWQQNTNSAQPYYAANLPSLPTMLGSGAINDVEVYNYEKCDPTNQGDALVQGAGYNDIVALYAIETGEHTITGVCEQL